MARILLTVDYKVLLQASEPALTRDELAQSLGQALLRLLRHPLGSVRLDGQCTGPTGQVWACRIEIDG